MLVPHQQLLKHYVEKDEGTLALKTALTLMFSIERKLSPPLPMLQLVESEWNFIHLFRQFIGEDAQNMWDHLLMSMAEKALFRSVHLNLFKRYAEKTKLVAGPGALLTYEAEVSFSNYEKETRGFEVQEVYAVLEEDEYKKKVNGLLEWAGIEESDFL